MKKHLWFLFQMLRQADLKREGVGIAADYVEEHGLWDVLNQWHARLSSRSIVRQQAYVDSVYMYRYRCRYMRVRYLFEKVCAVFARQM